MKTIAEIVKADAQMRKDIKGVQEGVKRLGNYKKCDCCKNEFFVSVMELYAYKCFVGNKPRFFCSWTCLEKYRNPPKKAPKTKFSKAKGKKA